MPDFGPYLIFCLYLSRMQKYAFFPVCANILGEILLPPAFFSFSAEGTCRLFCRRSADVKERMPFRGRAIYKKRGLSVKYTQ